MKNLKRQLELILNDVDRRTWLCKNAPLCENCAHEQVQLIDSFVIPAEWKCRICKTKFTFEPK